MTKIEQRWIIIILININLKIPLALRWKLPKVVPLFFVLHYSKDIRQAAVGQIKTKIEALKQYQNLFFCLVMFNESLNYILSF